MLVVVINLSNEILFSMKFKLNSDLKNVKVFLLDYYLTKINNGTFRFR